MNSSAIRLQRRGTKVVTSQLARQSTRLAVILFLSAAAYAQYGGGMGTSSTPSYGHGAAIGIGIGAAAAGVGTVYLLTHRISKVSGCVLAYNDGLRLTDDKTQKKLSLVAATADIKAGERVELKGKIKKGPAGEQNFLVKSVTKNFGQCQANGTPWGDAVNSSHLLASTQRETR